MKNKTGSRFKWFTTVCLAALLVTGCSNIPSDPNAPDNDPMEPLNRGVYQFNYVIDGLVLRPVASVYRTAMPEYGRDRISNFIENLYVPVTFANSVLQADPNNAFASFFRFVINTSIGIGGTFDVASEGGLKMRETDFGQTLAIYGAGPGPYVVLPIIGPSNVRDSVGHIADAFLNPFNYVDQGPGLSITMWSATAVDKRAKNMKLIDDIYSSSVDPYVTFRSGYSQHRASDIRRAKTERAASQEKAGF